MSASAQHFNKINYIGRSIVKNFIDPESNASTPFLGTVVSKRRVMKGQICEVLYRVVYTVTLAK